MQGQFENIYVRTRKRSERAQRGQGPWNASYTRLAGAGDVLRENFTRTREAVNKDREHLMNHVHLKNGVAAED
jgi:hypothetical protein